MLLNLHCKGLPSIFLVDPIFFRKSSLSSLLTPDVRNANYNLVIFPSLNFHGGDFAFPYHFITDLTHKPLFYTIYHIEITADVNRGKWVFRMRLAEGRCQPERPGADEKPFCPYSASPVIPISYPAKDNNLCISPNNKGFFLFCSTEKKLYFFNKISDLFDIKMDFAKLGLRLKISKEY